MEEKTPDWRQIRTLVSGKRMEEREREQINLVDVARCAQCIGSCNYATKE